MSDPFLFYDPVLVLHMENMLTTGWTIIESQSFGFSSGPGSHCSEIHTVLQLLEQDKPPKISLSDCKIRIK